MSGHVKLQETEHGTYLDGLKGPQEYQAAGKFCFQW
jgi:hypothetical protein